MKRDTLVIESRATAAIGAWVPTVTVRAATAVVSSGLCLLVLPTPFWRGMGILLTASSLLFPSVVPTWTVILLLCVNQIGRQSSASDATFYVLLAGVHLLHLLTSLARVLPDSGRLQLAALRRPLTRFVLIQAVVQTTAALTMLLFRNGPGTIRGLSIGSALALGAIAVVLAMGLRPRIGVRAGQS